MSMVAYLVPHTDSIYSLAEKKIPVTLYHYGKYRIPTFSIFIRPGYLPGGECCRRASHSLQYYTYMISTSYELHDTVPFAYGASFKSRKNAVAHLYKEEGELYLCGTHKNDNSDKCGTKFEGFPAGRTDEAKAAYGQVTAAS